MASARETTPRQGLVLAEIVDTAAEVFAERGFRKTTLDDIAGRLGVSRGGLYYYVDGKEDLLRRVMASFTETHARLVVSLREREDLSPSERLREAISAAVRLFGTHSDVMRVFLREEGELPAGVIADQRRFKHETDQAMRAIIAEGTARGQFRDVDPAVAAFAVFGMVNWLHIWFRPDGAMSTEEIADTFSEIALNGLVAGPGRSEARSIDGALRNLREDVAEVEREVERLRMVRRSG